DRAGFTGTVVIRDSDIARGHLEIEFVHRDTRAAHYDWFTQFIDLARDGDLCLPDAEQLRRTQGNTSIDRYRMHGFTTFKRLERLIYQHSGRSLGDFKTILDWGCGCGR